MPRDIKKFSTERLKKRVKAATVIISVCWSAVVVSIAIALIYGKSPFILASSAGFLGLFVATIAMLMGIKKAKEELAARNHNAGNTSESRDRIV